MYKNLKNPAYAKMGAPQLSFLKIYLLAPFESSLGSWLIYYLPGIQACQKDFHTETFNKIGMRGSDLFHS